MREADFVGGLPAFSPSAYRWTGHGNRCATSSRRADVSRAGRHEGTRMDGRGVNFRAGVQGRIDDGENSLTRPSPFENRHRRRTENRARAWPGARAGGWSCERHLAERPGSEKPLASARREIDHGHKNHRHGHAAIFGLGIRDAKKILRTPNRPSMSPGLTINKHEVVHRRLA